MTPTISVIVPVYNVEKYLKKCVNSILNQTFSDFELFLVDDGSTDSSGELCDQFADKDVRIVVIHKKNGGLSDARNVALDMATGEYICFIDSDDFVDSLMLENTYSIIRNENADIVISNHYIDRNNCSTLFYGRDDYIKLNAEQAIKLVFECKKSAVIACSKLYKRHIFENLRFPVGKICEDAFVIVDSLSAATKIVYDSHAYYHYVMRSGSISTAAYSKKEFDLIEAYSINLKKVQQCYPKIEKYAWFRYFAAINSVLYKMVSDHVSADDDDFQKIRNLLKKNQKKIFYLPRLSLKRKLMMFLMILIPDLYIEIEKRRIPD